MVAAPTMERIKSFAIEHDFRLNQMASRLRTRRTGVIGVVAPLGHERRQHLSDPFFMAMIGHLADALTENGYDLVLSRVIPDATEWLERIVGSGMLDGVLLLGQSDRLEAIERVATRYRPLVAWDGHHPDQVHCSVGTDNLLGGRMAGEHLLKAGAERVAFLGDVRTPEIPQRYEGLTTVLAERGAPAPLFLESGLIAHSQKITVAARATAEKTVGRRS